MIPLAIPAALSRIPWKWIGIGLLVAAALVQTIRLERAERRADKAQFSLNEAREALKEADRQSRQAQKETERRIAAGKVRNKSADDRARRVENAPLPGDCRTPDSILSLDI